MGIDWYHLNSLLLGQIWNVVWSLDFENPTDPFVFALQVLALITGAIKVTPRIIRKITEDY